MNGGQADLRASDPGLSRRLRRMRTFATALLVVMAVIYVWTAWIASPAPYIDAVRAFTEAALVGGLADWFAVTALFRRPLGLPIPHTAIVPARKNEIGRALARFIRDHFLVREAVERRLSRTNLAARLGSWLDEGGNAVRVSRDVGLALSWALREEAGGGELRGALGGTLRAAFDDVQVNRAVATVLEVLTTGERADLIIDQLVAFGRSELEHNRVTIRVRIHEQSPWWLPKFVDQEIFDKLVGGLEGRRCSAPGARRNQSAPHLSAARVGCGPGAGGQEPCTEGRARRTPGREELRVRALAAVAQRACRRVGGRDLAAGAGPRARDRGARRTLARGRRARRRAR
jgi:hypothetical protein